MILTSPQADVSEGMSVWFRVISLAALHEVVQVDIQPACVESQSVNLKERSEESQDETDALY